MKFAPDCVACRNEWMGLHAQNCAMVCHGVRSGPTWHDHGILVRCHKTKPVGEEFGKNWIKGSPDIQQDNYQTLGSSSCKAGLS